MQSRVLCAVVGALSVPLLSSLAGDLPNYSNRYVG